MVGSLQPEVIVWQGRCGGWGCPNVYAYEYCSDRYLACSYISLSQQSFGIDA